MKPATIVHTVPATVPTDLRGHLPALDGLRGIAILLVIVSHYLGPYWRSATIGWTGVNLFFVLSGFLITGILLDSKAKPHYFRNFYARRTLRIFPLYYLALVLIFLVAPRFPSLNTEDFREVARNQAWLWTYTMNFYVGLKTELGTVDPFSSGWVQTLHFWSLCVEEQFYLLWPAVVLLCSRRGLMLVTAVCFIGAWCLRAYFVFQAENVTASYFLMPCRMDDLATGAFIATALRSPDGLRKLRTFAPGLTVLSLWVLLGGWMYLGDFFQLDGSVQVLCYSAFALLYGCLLIFALAAGPSNIFVRLLNLRVLRSYGKYSYAIYMVHWGLSGLLFSRIAPLETLERQLGSQNAALGARVVIVAVVSYGIAFLSWHLFERHFLKLKSRFYAD